MNDNQGAPCPAPVCCPESQNDCWQAVPAQQGCRQTSWKEDHKQEVNRTYKSVQSWRNRKSITSQGKKPRKQNYHEIVKIQVGSILCKKCGWLDRTDTGV